MTFTLERAVCGECIPDPVLSREIRTEGTRRKCQICGERRLAVDAQVILQRLDEVYRFHVSAGAYWGSEFGQQGEYPEEIVAELLGCEHDFAEWTTGQLAAGEAYGVAHDGDEPMYDTGSRYELYEIDAWREWTLWRRFEEQVKHVRRFFSDQTSTLLSELLGEAADLVDDGSRLIVLDPDEPTSTIYRARQSRHPGEADEIAKGAPGSLGPPPPDKNSGGRMHAAGVSALYASFSRDTAIREMRPHVGGEVVSCEFRARRRLTLLNLAALADDSRVLSRFDDQYHRLTGRRLFLQAFRRIISLPVFPARERLDYLPTQAVSEYLVAETGVDGLVFPPAQGRSASMSASGTGSNNVVLFGAPFLNSTELDHLTATRPRGAAGAIYDLLEDPRPLPEPCLEMVEGSIQIHVVQSVKVETEERAVRSAKDDRWEVLESPEWW